jgi:LysM repeat protein
MKRPTILPPPPAPRLCPLCGSRVAENATKCLVCGTRLSRAATRPPKAGQRVYPSPLFLVILAAMILLGLLLVGLATGAVPRPALLRFPTPTITPTFTPRPTHTSTATDTETPTPTITPEPPISYVIKVGDSCLALAIRYDVTVDSIIQQNHLDPACTVAIGHTILIPHPTPTLAPQPSETPFGAPPQTATNTPPPYPTYVVVSGDTCLGIALRYGVTVADLLAANGLSDCNFLREGQKLFVPVLGTLTPTATATRLTTPTPVTTPSPPATATPSPLPTWPASSLLQPSQGQAFTAADATVHLHWAPAGSLRAGEFFSVHVEDITCNCKRIFDTATSQNQLDLPQNLMPAEATAHIFNWTVTTVRQKPGSGGGQIAYEPAGTTSQVGIFTWTGSGTPGP